MTDLHHQYQALGQRLAAALPLLTIQTLFLPPLVPPGNRGDCFGVMLLSDGSAGPFYVGLEGVLTQLYQDTTPQNAAGMPTKHLLDGFSSGSLATQALALGAFNALSQSLMRRARYKPSKASKGDDPKPGETVGMVGYFGRLARPWAAGGINIRVLELAPERVEDLPGIELAQSVGDLADCSRVICTSSVLVNQTLDAIIDGVGDAGRIDLVGPSGSGLPDVPLSKGVHSVGGVFFPDGNMLSTTLEQNGHWGKTGMRYTISAEDYPGMDQLLSLI